MTPSLFRPLLCGAALLMLAGCGTSIPGSAIFSALSSPSVPPPAGAVMAAPVAPTDPIAVFALNTPAGGSGVVNMGGVSQSARVQRVYHAASGRECREVVLGSGGAERAQVVCTDAAVGTRLTPPLLRGSR